jgi:hypothetical protein
MPYQKFDDLEVPDWIGQSGKHIDMDDECFQRIVDEMGESIVEYHDRDDLEACLKRFIILIKNEGFEIIRKR